MANNRFTTKRLSMEMMTDEQMTELINSQTDEHLRAAYSYMLEQSQADQTNRKWNALWSIRLKKEKIDIGHFCFMGAPVDGTVEIGYGIDEAYRRQEYGFEAIKEAIDVAFADTDVYFVRAGIEVEDGVINEASRAMLLKLGFKELSEISYGEDEENTDNNAGDQLQPAGTDLIDDPEYMGYQKEADAHTEKKDQALIYELEKPATSYLSIYMCLGISVGMCFGLSSSNTGIGLSIGLAIGVAIGVSLDNNDKKKREELKKRKRRMK